MYRANSSFHCALPDGTERFVQEGSVVSDEDPLVVAYPDWFATLEPIPPGTRRSTLPRRSPAGHKA